MPRREREADPGREAPPRVCCLVSELLEETGLDRAQVRRLRRQVLEGVILLCRWQLERMDAAPAPPRAGAGRRRARRVTVEQG